MAFFSSLFAKPADLFPRIAKNPLSALLLTALGLFTFVIPYFLYNILVKYLSASTASSLSVVEPLAATIYGIVFFGEISDIFSFIGIAPVLIAALLIGFIEKKISK